VIPRNGQLTDVVNEVQRKNLHRHHGQKRQKS
jgi:hypothetical protein